MSYEINRTSTIFIVDTGNYSGYFEREMVAFMTGHYGDCEVGSEIAEAARAEWKKSQKDSRDAWKDLEGDVDPYHAFDVFPEQDVTPAASGDGIFGLPEPLQFEGDGCKRPATIWPTEGWEHDGKGNFSKSNKPGSWAYMSVAVAFDNLTPQQIQTLTKRARYFCEHSAEISNYPRNESIRFSGIRVVRRVVTTTDTTLHTETV